MPLEVDTQPTQNPPCLKPSLPHLDPRLLLWHAQKVDFVEPRDETATVAPKNTMHVDRLELLVVQRSQNAIDMLGGRRNGRSVHGHGDEAHPVLPGFSFFQSRKIRQKTGIQDIFDVVRLQELKIGIGVGLRSHENIVINLDKVIKRCARRTNICLPKD
jgi:hypothetical protein